MSFQIGVKQGDKLKHCRKSDEDRGFTSVELRQKVKRIAVAKLFFDSFAGFMLLGW